MIPPILATQALTIITPVLLKGAEAFTEGIGKDIWEGIKGLFRKNNKEDVLKKLESKPNDEEVKQEVQFELASMLKEDPMTKEQLEKLITAYNNSQQQTIT